MYNVDDLTEVVANTEARAKAAAEAEVLLKEDRQMASRREGFAGDRADD